MALRVSLDSNVWERVVSSGDPDSEAIRNALVGNSVAGFICEAAFRIEAIPKNRRFPYFSTPLTSLQVPGDIALIDGKRHIRIMSFGPDDALHPGLPAVQAMRLKQAIALGVKLMRGMAWLGLPCPLEISDPTIFASEAEVERNERQQRQIALNAEIWTRGVGKDVFDKAGGWQAFRQGELSDKKIARACAEWADGELVAAHVAYRNDFLCTEDRAINSRQSIFNRANRSWLESRFGVHFANLNELRAKVSV